MAWSFYVKIYANILTKKSKKKYCVKYLYKYKYKYTYKYILIKRPLSQAPQVIDGQKRRNSDQGREAGGKLRLLLLLKFRFLVSLVRINTNIEKQNEILLQICIQIQTVIKAGKQEGNSCRFFFWNSEFLYLCVYSF